MNQQQHHAKAVRFALEEIDRNRDRYDDLHEQRTMLGMLIKKHELKELRTKGLSTRVVDLTIDRYREVMGYLVNKNPAAFSKDVGKTTQVFLKGSLMVPEDYLKKIGYQKSEEKQGGTTGTRVAVAASNKIRCGNESVGVQAAIQEADGGAAQTSAGNFAQSPPVQLGATSIQGSPSRTDEPKPKRKHLEIVDDEAIAGVKKPKLLNSGPPVKISVPDQALHPNPASTSTSEKRQETIAVPTASNRLAEPKATTSIISIVPELVEPMERAAMQTKLHSYKLHAETFAWDTLEGTRVDFNKRAELVLNPGRELKTLYQRIFGEDWKDRALLLLQTEFRAEDLLKALLCAALYNVAFVQELPWMSPDEAAEALRGFQPELDFNIKLVCNRNPTPTIRNLLWNTRKCQFENERFAKEEIVPHARDLAQSFMLIINSQLEVLGASKVGTAEQRDQFWRAVTATVSEAFQSAIALRGMMQVSRYHYDHQWAYSGDPVNCDYMEQTHNSGKPNRVRFSFWPAIWIRTTKDAERELEATAMVVSQKERSPNT